MLREIIYDGGSPNGSESFRRARWANGHHDLRCAVSNCRHYRLADVGACPTTLITMSQSVYVCESPAEVNQKLEAVLSLSLPRCLGDGSLLGRTE